jgi:hypothetical protein
MLVNETRVESGPIYQRTEQIEVGIRRDHDIQPSSGFKTLARLVEYAILFARTYERTVMSATPCPEKPKESND